MAKKDMFTINIDPMNVMYTNISSSKDGYNSARMVVKAGDNEYMSVAYEWEGSGKIPSFAMDLMGLMKRMGQEKSGVVPGQEDAYGEYMNNEVAKKCKGGGKKKDIAAEMCPTCGLPMDNSVPPEQRCQCKDKYDQMDHDNPEKMASSDDSEDE
jgi:hypothetical protein